MSTFPTARLYVDNVDSAIELFATLTPDQWTTPAPCTPGWTVRDLLSHMSGLADDLINGRAEGAGSEPWTAAQVQRYRDDDPQMLLERWKEQAKPVSEVLESINERRPVFDCHTHEHDIRHAIGLPGNRDSETVTLGGISMAKDLIGKAPVTLQVIDSEQTSFGDGPAKVSELTLFELFRSRLGRRSAEQVRSYNWSGSQGDIDATIESWFNFGPSPHPIQE